jgi:hypothetical protein
VEFSPAVPGGGRSFAVPDDSELDDSSFFGQNLETSPTQGLYPDIQAEVADDDTLGF